MVQNAATTAATLTIGNAQNLGGTFAGIIQDGAPSTGVATALNLKKAGSGTLLLSGANTYTGTTTFAGGALAIDNPASLGSGGPLSFTGGTLKYAYTPATETLSARFSTAAGQAYAIDTNGLDLTYATALSSTGGSLTKSGAGILTLAVEGPGGTATKLSGGITVTGGRLAIGDGYSHVNSTGGAITVASGATFYYSQNFISANPLTNPLTLSGPGDGAGTYGALELRGNATASGPITLAADATISHSYNNATVSGGITGTNKNLTLASTVAGQGALIVNGNISLGTGVLTKTGANAVKLGGVNSYASAVVSAGLLNFTANSALGGSGANILVESGGSVTATDLAALLPRIAPPSTGSLALPGGTVSTAYDLGSLPSLSLGASADTALTQAPLPGGGAYRFGGGGATLTVSAALGGASGLVVSGGTVVLTGAHTYSGATEVGSGTLQVEGTLSGAVGVASGATLQVGTTANTTASLVLSSPLSVAGTVRLRIDRSTTPTAEVITAPAVALTGALTVTNGGTALQAGDTFKLFNVSGTFTQTNATLNLPALNAGLAWDYSALLTTGTLRVVTFSSVGDPAWPHLLVGEFQAALTAGYSTITIAPGTYLLPDLPNYTSSFPISGKSNLTILADNVVLLVGKQRTFSLSACANVTLRGVTIRARYPSFTQGRIQSKGTNPDGTAYARWRISDGYPATFATDETYASTSTRFRADSSFNAVNQTTRTIDLATGDNYDCIVTDEGGGVWKVDFPARTSLPCAVNDWLVTRLPSANTQGYAVYLTNCTDCTLQSVTSQGGGFATFYEVEGGRNHLLACRIECSPDAPSGGTELPVVSCAADGVHARNATTGIHVEDCVFTGVLLDDCIAIHGHYRTVLSVTGNTVIYDDGDNDAATVATAGKFVIDRPVRISATNGFFAQTTCTNHEDLGDGTFRLTLADTWTIPVGARISNPDYNGGGYRIINNQLGGTRSRAIITKGDNGLISGNTIKNSGIAVNVGPEYYWEESDYCWNTTVTGNVIEDCRNGVNFVSDGAYGNKTVTITNNVFGTMLSGDAIALRGCQDVVVSGNYFAPLVNGNALDLATVNTITLANNLVEYTGTVQNRIARNTGTVTFLTGLNNGVLFAGRSTALTNTLGSFLLSALSFEWGSGGYHQILSATTGQALGVGASTTSGARVGLEAANGSDGQLWRLAPFGAADADTTLTLVNKLTGHTVTVSNGALIQQAAATGSTGQIWTPSFPSNYVYATWATSTGASTTVTADNDGDGLANLMEYALATPPLAAGTGPTFATATLTVNGTPASYLTITFVRRVAASDLTLAVEYSSDLATWSSSAVLVSSVPASDGTTSETWRTPAPVGTTARDFLRVRVTKP